MNDVKNKHPKLEIFYEYLDGELDTKKSASVEEHLKSCKLCEGKLKKLENFYIEISSMEEKEINTDISNSVLEALSLSRTKNSIFVLSPLFQIICSLLIFISIMVFRIPIDISIPNKFYEWLTEINLDRVFDLQLPKLSRLVFDSLNTLNFSIQIPALPKFPTIPSGLLFTLIICFGLLWLVTNRILLSLHNHPNNLKTENGG